MNKQKLIQHYKNFCESKGITFQLNDKVNPYDDTTLFCPSGMQQFKSKFVDISYIDTISNIQSCIRLNDINELGDGTHLLYFDMMGLFSFRQLSVEDTIGIWMDFLKEINIIPDYITIHPDRKEWSKFYEKYNMEVRLDPECVWSDGNIQGYCTEFYKNDIEIGNIVNPLGDCIDVGFGLDRLLLILGDTPKSEIESLQTSIFKIIDSGYYPSNVKQGYVLRKLLRTLYKKGGKIDHQFFEDEITRQEKIITRYNRLKDKNKDKSKEWWWDTMGIDIDNI